MSDVKDLFLLLENEMRGMRITYMHCKKAILKVGHHINAQGTSSKAKGVMLSTPSCNPGESRDS